MQTFQLIKYIFRKDGEFMCYNCGCQLPADDMGKGKLRKGGFSLTEDDIKEMAKEWDMSVKDIKANMIELLQKTLQDEN